MGLVDGEVIDKGNGSLSFFEIIIFNSLNISSSMKDAFNSECRLLLFLHEYCVTVDLSTDLYLTRFSHEK